MQIVIYIEQSLGLSSVLSECVFHKDNKAFVLSKDCIVIFTWTEASVLLHCCESGFLVQSGIAILSNYTDFVECSVKSVYVIVESASKPQPTLNILKLKTAYKNEWLQTMPNLSPVASKVSPVKSTISARGNTSCNCQRKQGVVLSWQIYWWRLFYQLIYHLSCCVVWHFNHIAMIDRCYY